MTPEFKFALLKLAAYYEKPLTDQQLNVYAEQLARSLTPDEVNAAIQLYVDDPSNEFFPRPVSKLIALIKKPVENKDQAQTILSVIKQAIVRKGENWCDGYFQDYQTVFEGKDYAYTTWEHAALSVIGDAALKVVRRSGGWKAICDFFYSTNEGTFNAQIIKLTESVLNLADLGMVDHLPALPQNDSVLKLVNIKQLPGVSEAAND